MCNLGYNYQMNKAYEVGDKFQESNRIWTLDRVGNVSVSLRSDEGGVIMQPISDFLWRIDNHKIIPLLKKEINRELGNSCAHIWQDEKYFTSRVFTNCTKCGIAKK